MRGILKITALLMGSLLCIFTLTVGQARSHELPDRVPLMAQDDPKYGSEIQRLVQIWPGVSQPLILTDYETFVYVVGVDAAGTSLYYEFQDEDQTHRNLYRIGPTSLEAQLLVDTLDGAYGISPNLTWVLYCRLGNPNANCWAKNIQTRQEWAVSGLIQPRKVDMRRYSQFSADEQWLYLPTYISDQMNTEIIAFHLADARVSELTSIPMEPSNSGVKGVIDDWVIFGSENHLYRIRNDGTGLSLLFDENEIMDVVEGVTVPDYVAATYPEHDLVIVHHRNLILGINSETGQILWQYTKYGGESYKYPPSGWVVLNAPTCCQRLDLLTGVTENMNEDSANQPEYLASDPTGRWMAYAEMNPVTQHRDFWLYDWDTGQSRLIRRAMDSFGQYAWSPDGEWLLMEDEIHYNLYRLRVSDGYLEQLTTEGRYHLFGWMRPPVQTWQPLPLFLIGLALIIIGLIPRRLFKLSRRRPVLMSRTLSL